MAKAFRPLVADLISVSEAFWPVYCDSGEGCEGSLLEFCERRYTGPVMVWMMGLQGRTQTGYDEKRK